MLRSSLCMSPHCVQVHRCENFAVGPGADSPGTAGRSGGYTGQRVAGSRVWAPAPDCGVPVFAPVRIQRPAVGIGGCCSGHSPPSESCRARPSWRGLPQLPGQQERVSAGTALFLASLNTATGRWVPVPSRYNRATGAVSARVRHFSIWEPLDWVRARIAAVFNGALLSLFGVAGFGVFPPATASRSLSPTASRTAL